MNEEAYRIRSEINRLNKRLLEIEKENLSQEEQAQMCSSNVCGHDVVLNYMQKLCNERDSKSIAIMAGWERGEQNKWYSTTITSECLPYLIRNVETIKNYLEPILDVNTLRVLQYLSIECENASLEKISKKLDIAVDEITTIIEKLIEQKVILEMKDNEIENKWCITVRGWHTYIVLAHLSFNYTLKLDIEKAIHIAPVFKEVFDREWGQHLGISYEKVIERLTNTGWIEKLKDLGVNESDIEKAVYEANYIFE